MTSELTCRHCSTSITRRVSLLVLKAACVRHACLQAQLWALTRRSLARAQTSLMAVIAGREMQGEIMAPRSDGALVCARRRR